MPRFLSLAVVLSLSGCGFVSQGWLDANVRDLDGDGFISDRFDGPDCQDDDPSIGDCDEDGDGFLSRRAGGTDCDDSNADVFPGAVERCNGLDDDCDGGADDADPEPDSIADRLVSYQDVDGDGFGAVDAVELSCVRGEFASSRSGDCDDNDATIHPEASEACDDVDRDCSGLPRDNAVVGTVVFRPDVDEDGYGDLSANVGSGCAEELPAGAVIDATDCNDLDANVNPGQVETGDGVDNDCDPLNDSDLDGDGFTFDVDCDDEAPSVHPGAPEQCNNGDDNCDGVVDNATLDDVAWFDEQGFNPALGTPPRVYFRDVDLDGHGALDLLLASCETAAPEGWSGLSDDCDDADARRSPSNEEVCDNGLDNNCDGQGDNNAVDGSAFFRDGDGDGFGTPDQQQVVCEQPVGWVSNDEDCDDQASEVRPGAIEICGDQVLQDCARPSALQDCDGDGFIDAFFPDGDDCDDDNEDIKPSAVEICDGLDNDCNGQLDNDDPNLDDTIVVQFLADVDGDGFGSTVVGTSEDDCTVPPDAVANTALDCDDSDPTVNPGAPEICDDRDNDCDQLIDGADDQISDAPTYYFDADGDGFGDPGLQQNGQCDAIGPEWVLQTDCDDTNDQIFPGAVEICDQGIDNDCDGVADDDDSNVEADTWYQDEDEDLFGNSGSVLFRCLQPVGYVSVGGDCDDTLPDVGADRSWYLDADGDGFGNADDVVSDCATVPGRVERDDDCDDTQASVSPAAIEVCDSIDNDCDGTVDDNDSVVVNRPVWYADSDADGWGDVTSSVAACAQPAGSVSNAGDCDDASAQRSPGALEVCDGLDNDCDGQVDDDDDVVFQTTLWARDDDGDGFGDPADVANTCVQPVDFVANAADCDDGDANRAPDVAEVCDGLDNNCDGRTDDADPFLVGDVLFEDLDGDGVGSDRSVNACLVVDGIASVTGDCDDLDAQVNPAATEICNGADDDCDGVVPANELTDADGDQFVECSDCDDTTPARYPGAAELCDGVFDNDCDGGAFDPEIDQDGDGFSTCEGDPDDTDPGVMPPMVAWFQDGDGDGYGTGSPVEAPVSPGPTFVQVSGDCDDTAAGVNPEASDASCDGIDDDCDGLADQDAPLSELTTFSADVDGDGFGNGLSTVDTCFQPDGYVLDSEDCDDLRADVFPGADELCDGVDANCSGDVEVDADGDGWLVCEDCDDNNVVRNPGQAERCDGEDNDCDGLFDADDSELVDGLPLAVDVDGDGWFVLTADVSCEPTDSPLGDCDDGEIAKFPGADEVCDAIDNDCDGAIDADDSVFEGNVYYVDADDDGLGAGEPIERCSPGDQHVTNNLDCNDNDDAVQFEGQTYQVPANISFASMGSTCTNSILLLAEGAYNTVGLTDGQRLYGAPNGRSQILGTLSVRGGVHLESLTFVGGVLSVDGGVSTATDLEFKAGAGLRVLDGDFRARDLTALGPSSPFLDSRSSTVVLEDILLDGDQTSVAVVSTDGDNVIRFEQAEFTNYTNPGNHLFSVDRTNLALVDLTVHDNDALFLRSTRGNTSLERVSVLSTESQGNELQFDNSTTGTAALTDVDLVLQAGATGLALIGSSPQTTLTNVSIVNQFAAADQGILLQDGDVTGTNLLVAGGHTNAAVAGNASKADFSNVTFVSNTSALQVPQANVMDSVLTGGTCAASSLVNTFGSPGCGVDAANAVLTYDKQLTPSLWDFHVNPTSAAVGVGWEANADWHDDVDQDGLPDGWEQDRFGSLIHDALQDPDLDGFTNDLELRFGTHPLLSDTDGDGARDDSDAFPLNPVK